MPKGIPNKKLAAVEVEHNEYEPLFLQSLKYALPTFKLFSDAQLTRRIGEERLSIASLEFFGFIVSGAGEDLKKNELLALANQSWNSLSSYIKNMGMPVTLNTLLDSIPLLDSAVDVDFPGYAASGLLKFVILPQRS